MANRELIQRRAREVLPPLVNKMGVCSFGADPSNILMWSHYTDHHTGVCIQLELAKSQRNYLLSRPWIIRTNIQQSTGL